MMEYFLCMTLFTVGLYAVVVKRDLVKIIIGIAIMDYAVNLFLIGYVLATFSFGEVQGFVTDLAYGLIIGAIGALLYLTRK